MNVTPTQHFSKRSALRRRPALKDSMPSTEERKMQLLPLTPTRSPSPAPVTPAYANLGLHDPRWWKRKKNLRKKFLNLEPERKRVSLYMAQFAGIMSVTVYCLRYCDHSL
ncbi:hypothetical protein COOONC_11484 [Cooperia oncophora]